MPPESYRRLLILLATSYLLAWACVEAFVSRADFQSLGASPIVQGTGRTAHYGGLSIIAFAILSVSSPVVVYKYATGLDPDDRAGRLMPLLIIVAAFVLPPAGLAILLLKRGPAAPGSNGPAVSSARLKAGEPRDWSQGVAYLTSAGLGAEVRRAMEARDQAARDAWIRTGRPGAGKTLRCEMCGKTTYGEETVIERQEQAIYAHAGGPLAAQRWEMSSGYRCKSCRSEYCKRCLEEKAPGNVYGGKSCPRCGGLFEVIHG